ncbi:MAG: rhodanese-like domain-containing protein [Balneolaceae bacterium]|nr:rhodanese-like domain-containing protein [Balneolaceae bacterium]
MTEVETLRRISAQDLKKRLQSDNRPVLINALSRDAYRAKRIPGSISIPTEDIEMIENIVPDKNQDIVVYCANEDCDASPNAASALMDNGYENVWDFEAGLAGWKNAGYTLRGNETG